MISTLEDTIRRDRALAAVCVALITSLAWLYLIRMSASMTTMGSGVRIEAMEMVDTRIWGPASWFGLFGMWAVMMTGMMLPSVSPVLLHMLQIYRRRGDHLARRSAVAFVGGHLAAWTLFGAVAATVQVGLHRVALLDASLAIESTVLAGALLLAVGIYQCLPVKSACLTHCRPPLRFLSMKRRDGTRGAFTMGLEHGGFCVGCCFALMTLMFVGGVMNLLWAAAIAILVLIEKIAPRRLHVEYASGLPMIAWGVAQLARQLAG
jgi:predicted metal-binding membrane protein